MSGQVLESLHDVVSAEHPTYIGGGTDIMPLLKNKVRDDKDFVFLKKIPELHVLEEKDGELIIGAAMTLTELAESELLNSRYAAIAQAASLTASPQIRNIATVGGNIMPVCRAIYYSDVATALIAYETEVEYIEDGETHRTDLKSLIERHSVANGLACHEHLPILVTRFFIPRRKRASAAAFISTPCARRSTSRSSTSRSAAAAIAPRVWPRARSRPIRS